MTGTTAFGLVLGAALAILLVGMYLGPRAYLENGGSPWSRLLPVTFEAWESGAPGEHLFLTFLSKENLANRNAYPHYSQPWMFLQYLWLQPFRWLGISYSRSHVWVCLPQAAVILLLLVVHVRDRRPLVVWPVHARTLARYVVLAMAVAAVLTLPAFWVPFFRFTPDHYFLLPALGFCHLAAADYRGTLGPRDLLIVLLPMALLAPLMTPFLAASWLLLWGIEAGEGEGVDWRTARRLAVLSVLGLIVFAIPKLLVYLGSMISGGSPIRFRTGLDGSEEYFTSMAQALWAPSYPPGRAWQLWQWPIAAFAAIGVAGLRAPATAARMLRQLFICWVPLLWLVIVFPQWVSIHPYCTDFHITLGAAFCLAFWLSRPELEAWSGAPALRLAIAMACAALLMTNLIDLARLGRFRTG